MRKTPRPARLVRIALLLVAGSACESGTTRRPAQPLPPGYYGQPGPMPPGGYPPPAGGYPPQGAYPPPSGQYPPAGPTAPPSGPTPGAPVPNLPPVTADPINQTNLAFLRDRAQVVMRELVAALDSSKQQRVARIPLVVDDAPGEVNAFAACTRDGTALMAISDGLLIIQAHLAQAQAEDELFGTAKVDEYIRFLAQNQRPGQPVVALPPGFFHPSRQTDGRKVARQHQILDEQLAFVLGHELAHHYLGHLPCTGDGGLSVAEVGRVLSSAVPVFNQPNELAADVAGTSNVLRAGSRQQGQRWTEAGGLLTMRFFSGFDQFSPADIVFGFERTHPPPALRVPVIQQAANTWRSTGGNIPLFGL